MSEATRYVALSEFLRSHRAKLQPRAVGLPAGTRRRTPGLRREEVASIAGVSSTWYTWLEQGRDIQASAQVLDRIAFALQLNEDERRYLFMLASDQRAAQDSPVVEPPPPLPPALQRIIGELRHCPAIVSDRRCHIIGWNEAAAKVFLDFGVLPEEERNMVSLLFKRKEFKSLAVNWADFVRGFLAIFRSYYGQYVGDPWYTKFIDIMSSDNPEFRTMWNHNDVSSAPEVLIEFRHTKAGKMLFDLTSFQVQGRVDLRCSVYTPSEGSDTEANMKQLMSRTSGGKIL